MALCNDDKLNKEIELSAKLQRCPFCGNAAWLSLDWSPTTYQIECRGCNAFLFRNHTVDGFDADIADLMARWNRRVVLDHPATRSGDKCALKSGNIATDERYTVCLLFQDLKLGDFRDVYPQGMSGEMVMALIADPAKQFAPVPPPPAPPPYP